LYSSFFVLGYHLINKMAKKKVFRRRWRRFFFLVWFYFIFFFFAGKHTNKFCFFVLIMCGTFSLKKRGGSSPVWLQLNLRRWAAAAATL
jgi:hypothetical protein